MVKRRYSQVIVNTLTVLSLAIAGCSGSGNTEPQTKTETKSIDLGNLVLVANGEDFVRQSFITKDNWQLSFERVSINVGNAIAFSTDGAFDPEQNKSLQKLQESKSGVTLLETPTTVDLAAGESDAPPIVVQELKAPVGSYNVLAWEMMPHDDSGLQGQTVVLQGQAVKDGEAVDFTIGFAVPVKYLCGEFVGDTRKGIVTQDNPAEVEMTFHFDHIFGDRETPTDDALNQEALGFQPLADLSQSGVLNADWQTLEQELEVAEREKLVKAIANLGHVGEGHCKAEYEL